MLRAAIKERGIDHLCAKTGQEAHRDMQLDIEQRGQEHEYDPLMSCYWMIMNRGMEIGGLYMLRNNEDGSQRCPVCEASKHKTDDQTTEYVEGFWTNGPADVVLKECQERGLI